MSKLFWKRVERPDTSESHEPALEVNEQHPLPGQLFWKPDGSEEYQEVSAGAPYPVQVFGPSLFKSRVPISADVAWVLALEGRVYVGADGDQNDRVTGQTSFVNTTPSFMLRNPILATSPDAPQVLVLPYYYQLAQTGSVAGADIGVDTEIVSPDAFSSGTAEQVKPLRIGMASAPKNRGLLFSTVTAVAGYGSALGHVTLGPDISPAEGVINIYEWQAPVGCILDTNTSLNVFTYASTTGPTWGWHYVWAEVPAAWF